MKKSIVVIGGGNGSSSILRCLKPFAGEIELSAVISVADSGRTSGRIRRDFKMIPPSDVMRACLALSPYDYHTLRSVFFTNRFDPSSVLAGHNLGSMVISWDTMAEWDVKKAIQNFQHVLGCVGTVYPVTTTQVDLCVELTDGTTVRGEGAIDEPAYDRSLRITRAWLEPEGTITNEAKSAIEAADALIIGPSSVYTSIMSTLLVGGVREAIGQSTADIIYVPSTYLPMDGETGPITLSQQVSVIESALPRGINTIIVNSERLENDPKKPHRIRLDDYPKDVEHLPTHQCIIEDLSDPTERMNLKKLGDILLKNTA